MSGGQKTLLLRTLLCAGCCLPLAIAAAVWFRPSPLCVRVFDSNFHVRSVRVLRSPDDSFYLGNQFEGDARAFLNGRCYLKVKTLPDISGLAQNLCGTRIGGCTFALRYAYDGTPSPVSLDAELVDCSGTSLGVGGSYTFGTNPYCLFMNLDRERTSAGDYTLKLKRAGVCLVEVEIKGLPPVLHEPYHIGPNAF